MRKGQRARRLFVLAALAGLLVSTSPARAEEQGDLRAQAEAAIAQAAAFLQEAAQTLTVTDPEDTESLDRHRDAEKELRRAQSRFASGNYEGALDHAARVEAALLGDE